MHSILELIYMAYACQIIHVHCLGRVFAAEPHYRFQTEHVFLAFLYPLCRVLRSCDFGCWGRVLAGL